MFDSVLAPRVQLTRTCRFSCFNYDNSPVTKKYVYIDLVSTYTSEIVEAAVSRRDWCIRISDINSAYDAVVFQICDFELIDWEPVLTGKHSGKLTIHSSFYRLSSHIVTQHHHSLSARECPERLNLLCS